VRIAISASRCGYHAEDADEAIVSALLTSNVYGTIKERFLFDAIRITQGFWCSTMQNYHKFSTGSISIPMPFTTRLGQPNNCSF